MLSLMKGVFGPSISYQDKIMYMTSLELNHSINSDDNDNIANCMETIIHLVSSGSTRYMGMQLLELALQQNCEHYYSKGRWIVLCFSIIKDSRAAPLEKIQACKVLNLMMPYIANDSSANCKDELVKDIYPLLLEKINENVEWAEEACICVKMSLKAFPNQLAFHEPLLLDVILNQATYNVSSKSFEVLAECFCEIPYCGKDTSADVVKGRWRELYFKTLKTIESLQVLCLSKLRNNDEPYNRLGIDIPEFAFKDEECKTFFQSFLRHVRRFVNLCKCLAKLLSMKSRFSVKVPTQFTIKCLIPLYTVVSKKDKVTDNEGELLTSFLAQMQLAGLVVLESLILNCNLLKNAALMKDLILVTIRSSCKVISSERVSELRIGVWKLLRLWLNGFGRSVSKDIAQSSEIIEELLKDIDLEANESLQASNPLQTHKSKKNSSSCLSSKSVLKKKNIQRTCEAGLKSLKSLLNTGALDFPKGIFQEICDRLFKICHTVQSSYDPFPSPYNDETCRKQLYSVILAIAVVLKPDEVQSLQTAMIILTQACNDPSFKVRTFSNKAPAIYRLQLYSKRPLPICSDNKQRQLNVSDERINYPEWSSEEYVQNIKTKNVSETSENVHTNAEQSFQYQSEVEVQSEEYMDVDTHYSEQVVENQCNGEDILEVQSSSQGQDDVESDEEDEEDDEERSYGEEEMNQEEPQQEMYIPTTKKVQIPTPVQIDSETIQNINEPEYEELTTTVKTEEKSVKISNKNTCVNGDDTVMCDENMPSSSKQQTVGNENGIFGIDEEDDLDEDNDEEEDEEETESYPAERREEIYDPPLKKQKVETKEDAEEERKETRSPTLEEMKANFLEILPSIEDVRSGKVQLSTS